MWSGTKKSGNGNPEIRDQIDLITMAEWYHPAVRVIEIGDWHVILDLGTVFDQIRDVAQPPTPKRSIRGGLIQPQISQCCTAMMLIQK